MANWAGAVETFGKGLFAVGQTVVRREDDEIAFMRQKALQELGIQAQKDLQTANQEFLKGQAKEGREHDQTMFGMEAAARRGETELGHQYSRELFNDQKKWDAQRDASSQSFQLRLKEADNKDDIIRFTNTQLADLGKSIDTWEQEMLAYDGGDPEVQARYQSRIDALYAQQDQVRNAAMAAISRATGGKPRQPGPTKEAAAELPAAASAQPGAAAAPAAKVPPAGAYLGGESQAAPAAAESSGNLFEISPEKTPWAYKNPGDINRAIGERLGGAFIDDSPTGQINRKIRDSLFGN